MSSTLAVTFSGNEDTMLLRGLVDSRSANADEIRNLSVQILKMRPDRTISHLPSLIEILVQKRTTEPKIHEALTDLLCCIAKLQKHIENDNVIPIHLLGHAQVLHNLINDSHVRFMEGNM
jgi:hypothetical protein